MLESKYGSPRIVNDGVTVAKEVELEDPVENIGAKLVRQVRAYQLHCNLYIFHSHHDVSITHSVNSAQIPSLERIGI